MIPSSLGNWKTFKPFSHGELFFPSYFFPNQLNDQKHKTWGEKANPHQLSAPLPAMLDEDQKRSVIPPQNQYHCNQGGEDTNPKQKDPLKAQSKPSPHLPRKKSQKKKKKARKIHLQKSQKTQQNPNGFTQTQTSKKVQWGCPFPLHSSTMVPALVPVEDIQSRTSLAQRLPVCVLCAPPPPVAAPHGGNQHCTETQPNPTQPSPAQPHQPLKLFPSKSEKKSMKHFPWWCRTQATIYPP